MKTQISTPMVVVILIAVLLIVGVAVWYFSRGSVPTLSTIPEWAQPQVKPGASTIKPPPPSNPPPVKGGR